MPPKVASKKKKSTKKTPVVKVTGKGHAVINQKSKKHPNQAVIVTVNTGSKTKPSTRRKPATKPPSIPPPPAQIFLQMPNMGLPSTFEPGTDHREIDAQLPVAINKQIVAQRARRSIGQPLRVSPFAMQQQPPVTTPTPRTQTMSPSAVPAPTRAPTVSPAPTRATPVKSRALSEVSEVSSPLSQALSFPGMQENPLYDVGGYQSPTLVDLQQGQAEMAQRFFEPEKPEYEVGVSPHKLILKKSPIVVKKPERSPIHTRSRTTTPIDVTDIPSTSRAAEEPSPTSPSGLSEPVPLKPELYQSYKDFIKIYKDMPEKTQQEKKSKVDTIRSYFYDLNYPTSMPRDKIKSATAKKLEEVLKTQVFSKEINRDQS